MNNSNLKEKLKQMPFDELLALYVEAKTGSRDAVQWMPDSVKDAADDLTHLVNSYLRAIKATERV